jgi:hypothetical protein
MRVVCFMPSEPVMPWTMTLESAVRKIAMSLVFLPLRVLVWVRATAASSATRRAAPSIVSTRSSSGSPALVEDLPTLLGVVAVEAHDERLGSLAVALRIVVGLDDAVGDGVAGGDAAEDVDEDALTCGSSKMMSSPLAMTSALAPPPMSRKLAGLGCRRGR